MCILLLIIYLEGKYLQFLYFVFFCYTNYRILLGNILTDFFYAYIYYIINF